MNECIMNYEAIYNQVYGGSFSILGFDKSKRICQEIESIINLDGDTAEIGVYTGYTSKLIHTLMPNKTHYCYDTFCGILGADKNIDLHNDGDFKCSLNDVKNVINMKDVEYRVGYFPDSFTEHDKMFCFVHSDTDTYIGTKNTLKYFCDKIVSGGKIIFDDYKWYGCPGVEKAISEFEQTNTEFEIEKYDLQCILTKKQNLLNDLSCKFNNFSKSLNVISLTL